MSTFEDFIDQVSFNEDGLVPVVAQDSITKDVLMLAWMNEEALRLSLETGKGTYFSRSRSRLWVKGEESGNVQHVRDIRRDCDSDALVMTVQQHGPACHTGSQSCFFNIVVVDQ
jgi:phosphoribosyl-AMP cyclohydrolase